MPEVMFAFPRWVQLSELSMCKNCTYLAALFAVGVPAINKQLKNIFECNELDENSVCSILEHTAPDGKTYYLEQIIG